MKETGNSFKGGRLKPPDGSGKAIQRRSQYYQTIASHFFQHRGAPFFLSSREIDLIVEWEKKGIPLRVVLEGIGQAFEDHRMKPGKKGKVLSLSFCRSHVLKAHALYTERKVGNVQPLGKREQKRIALGAALERFLAGMPESLSELKGFYQAAQKEVSRRRPDERKLERIEEEAEESLLRKATGEDEEQARKEAWDEFKVREGEEFKRIFRLKLAKHLREKYKIPYLSLFYY